jgi:hypothetical protein
MSATTIKLLSFHPLVKLFPEMSAIEFNELVADIEKHGQRNDIDTWNGEIIEGRHRALACQKLGIEPRYRARRFESEIGARDYVVSQNFARRHMTPENKRILIAALADWSKSDRAIAGQTKTNRNLVGKVRKEVEEKEAAAEQKKATVTGVTVEGEKATVTPGTVKKKRTGKDGKVRKQPVKKQKAAAKVEPKQTADVGKCSYCKKREGQLLADDLGGLPPRYACDECLKEAEKAFPAAEPKPEPERNGEGGDDWNDAGPDSHLNHDGTYAVVNRRKPAAGMRIQGFFFRARESERGARMDNMSGLPVDEDTCKAAQAAADAWTELARTLAARRSKAAPATAADDYPDLPAALNRALQGAAA